MSVRFLGDIVTLEEVIHNGVLIVDEKGIIEGIETSSSSSAMDIDVSGRFIVPGFVDVHVHGGGGADFMDATEEAVRRVAATHGRFGATTLLATTLTAPGEQVSRCLRAVRKVMDRPESGEARIAGVHLEGPYICPAKRGAQPLAPIRPADWRETQRWMAESSGAVKLITMAPEMPGALEFIRQASAEGIIVSIGHTNADYEQTQAGIAAGASHATHLFNAMPPLHHRQPGAIGALLTSPSVLVELIVDGVHLHPAIVKLAVSAAGSHRVVLITDAMSGAAMPDGLYELAGTPVIVEAGAAKYADGTLAGSVLTMNTAFFNVQKFAEVAPQLAARMASSNAARQIGIGDWTGSLEVGKRADLAILNPRSGAVEGTVRDGKWIWRA